MSAGVEIGKVIAGTESNYWIEGYANSAGGIGAKHEYYNASDKTIKYVTFEYVPYNTVGDIVVDSVSHQAEKRGKITGPIEPNEKVTAEWDILWYNSTISTVKVKSIFVQYMDGSEEVINEEDIKFIENEDSVYYERRGKEEIAKQEEEEAKRKESIEKAGLRKSYTLSYISFLVFFTLKNIKTDEVAKFHANQGLLLFIVEVIAVLVSYIPYVGGWLSFALWALAIVFSIVGIVNVQHDKQKEVPVIGKIKLLK